ncbi:MAG: glycoside hydrolase family 3 protein [Lachnospiraceae bacterium]|nr:glycoside hydrolase family 3 protein [Lachnospiraceae bacterium]
MKRRRKHKNIVFQRFLAFILTVLIIAGIAAGILAGIRYIKNNETVKAFFEKKPEPVSEAVEATSEEATEDGDIWVRVAKETISDDYADVDTSVLSENEVSENIASIADTDAEIEMLVNALALEEKVAQLFIVTPEQITGTDQVTRAGETTKNALTEYPVGGLYYSKSNFEDPDQTKEMLLNTSAYIIEACGIAPFLSVQEEGGETTSIACNEKFELEGIDPMSEIGKTGDIDKAYEAGEVMGRYMSSLGLNLDFAPIANIVNDKTKDSIGNRAFGNDPEKVSKFSWQLASGLQDAGVTACFKLYPDYVSVSENTPAESLSLQKTRDELIDNELIPFQNAALSDARMIMASHISCPNITGDDMPSSLSSVMLTDILRNEIGFKGVIATDALNAKPVTDKYPSSGEAAIAAINAGADLLLMPADFHEAYNSVLSAVSSGQIETERINDSLRRILKIKLGKY